MKGVTQKSVNQATAPGSTGFANESHLLPQVIKKGTSRIDRSFEILILLCRTKIICIQTTGHTWIELTPHLSPLFHLSLSPRSALLLCLSYFLPHKCPVPVCCNWFPLETLSNLPESFKNPYLCLPLSSISAPSLHSRLFPFSVTLFLPTLWQAMWLCFLPAFSSCSLPFGLFLCQHQGKTGHLRLRLQPIWRDSNRVKTQLGTLTQEAWTQTRPKPS